MNTLEEWKTKHNRGLGVDLSEIETLQSDFNLTFPLAYKEFLLLSGKYCAAVPFGNHRFEYALC